MSTPYDPEHGDLCRLVQNLDSIQGEMITSDLRDLKIPAVLRRQIETARHPDTSEQVDIQLESFEILVPEAFLEISQEVLDVTHMQQQGDATTAEILADLQMPTDPVPVDEMIEGASMLRRSEAAGRWLLKATLGLLAAVVLFLIWRSMTS